MCSGRRAGDPPGSRTCTVVFPFCHLTLNSKKPLSNQYPTVLKTIGDQIRKRRLDLGLLQREVADRIGAMKDSVYLWEANRVAPTLPFLPKIIEFLGYCPFDPDWTPGERLTWIRRYFGLSQEAMARRLRVDPGTLARWERGEMGPKGRFVIQLIEFIDIGSKRL
ncbi:MAG: helix-turn-helix transcriptional regulator [Candidatus Methylomirabilia bacterium]